MFDFILLLLICQMNLHLTFYSLLVELDLIGTTCGIYLQLMTVIVHLLKREHYARAVSCDESEKWKLAMDNEKSCKLPNMGFKLSLSC